MYMQAEKAGHLQMAKSADLSPPRISRGGQNNVISQWRTWTVEDLQEKLRTDEVSEKIRKLLLDENIAGKHLKYFTKDILMEKGLTWSDCLELQAFLEKHGFWKSQGENQKIFNDPIHGNIQLHPACIAIIDTPQFQRLRYLKQLGLVYFVYPGAAHNRFEHCLGVCYLAGRYVRTLRENQSELGITEIDAICVEIAGLCHDLGHGPFSHLFDGKFMPKVYPRRGWNHEQASIDMFQHLIDDNGLMKKGGVLREFGLTERDITFIKEQIVGPSKKSLGEWPYMGRGKGKAYLYEIVSNRRNGIDVDKWDYLARDCHQLGFKNNFDHDRFIKFARVIEVEGEMQICLRDKEIMNLYSMFATRYTLHKNAYQHRVHSALEMMVAQALFKANNHVFFTGRNGKKRKISECVDDMVAYTELHDEILFKILYTEGDHPDLKDAQRIIRRIMNRDLYKCVAESRPVEPEEFEKMQITKSDDIEKEILETEEKLQEGDFFIQIVQLDFGMKEENPVKKLNVYSKDRPDEAKDTPKEEISKILAPYICKELLLRVYSSDRSTEKCELVKETFQRWFKSKELAWVEREKMAKSAVTVEESCNRGEQWER